MKNQAIGFFDSGFGGLTALRAFRRLLPEVDVIYFADTGRVPYGAKTAEELRIMARQDLDFLAQKGVKAILAACGTVSTAARQVLQDYPLPVFGVLEPSVRAMAEIAGNAPLGIIATQASIQSGAYAGELSLRCPGRKIIPIACPDFVPLIESGHTSPDDPAVQEAVERYLQPIRAEGAAALLLGCTHYGLLEEAIRSYLGEGTQLVSASECAVKALREHLNREGLCGGTGKQSFFTSGSAEHFLSLAPQFLGESVEHVETLAPKEIRE